jgi:hypothetical protein
VSEKADNNDSFSRCFVHSDHQPYNTAKTFTEHSYKATAIHSGSVRVGLGLSCMAESYSQVMVSVGSCEGRGPEVQREYRPAGPGVRTVAIEQQLWDEALEMDSQELANKARIKDPMVTSTMESQRSTTWDPCSR